MRKRNKKKKESNIIKGKVEKKIVSNQLGMVTIVPPNQPIYTQSIRVLSRSELYSCTCGYYRRNIRTQEVVNYGNYKIRIAVASTSSIR